MKRYQHALVIFRRDLRLIDNSALNAARQQADKVLPCFIFDPRQLAAHPYQSQPGLRFMRQALLDLQHQFDAIGSALWGFSGQPETIVAQLHAQHRLDAVFVNRDYTPFSRQRDAVLAEHCQALGIAFHSHGDALLTEPEQVLRNGLQPYQVFSPFHRAAKTIAVSLPQPLQAGDWLQPNAENDLPTLLAALPTDHASPLHGGRSAAIALLNTLSACQHYKDQRDFPALNATSQLSAALKFGCCSIREAYAAVSQQLGHEHPLLRQFYWRDFFSHIAYHYPHVFGHAFNRRYDALEWNTDEAVFWRWANGQTGFPIVDAGMRQLNATGLMHNRLRMITASFLVKDLHISWRWGERYFAQKLVDYDPCLNNGNWQWAASTGCDAQPYFRIFNPWLQQKKFDPDCTYIKRWLPELSGYSAQHIHNWAQQPAGTPYPAPMCDHAVQSALTKQRFQSLSP